MIYLNQAATTYPKQLWREGCKGSVPKITWKAAGYTGNRPDFFLFRSNRFFQRLDLWTAPCGKNSSGQPNRAQQYSASADEFKRPGGTGSGHSL